MKVINHTKPNLQPDKMDPLVLKLTSRSLEAEIALDQINLSLLYSYIALLIFCVLPCMKSLYKHVFGLAL